LQRLESENKKLKLIPQLQPVAQQVSHSSSFGFSLDSIAELQEKNQSKLMEVVAKLSATEQKLLVSEANGKS
jgi:hypothetical protein